MVYSGVTDRDGHEWFATDRGLIRYDDTTGKWLSLVTRGALSRVRATTLLATGDGPVWVGSLGDGILRWQLSKDKLETYDKLGGTSPHNHELALCQDSLGSVWAGTAGGGLSEWRKYRFERVAQGNEDPSFVNALWEDPKGCLWVGAMSGIMIISADRQNVIPFSEASTQERLSVHVSSVVGDQEHFFIGTEGHWLVSV